MFKFILPALLALSVNTSFAEEVAKPAEGSRPHITLEQVLEKASKRFDELDTNKDGKVTLDELKAGPKEGKGPKRDKDGKDGKEGKGSEQRPQHDFPKDGMTKEEWLAKAKERFEAMKSGKGGRQGGPKKEQ